MVAKDGVKSKLDLWRFCTTWSSLDQGLLQTSHHFENRRGQGPASNSPNSPSCLDEAIGKLGKSPLLLKWYWLGSLRNDNGYSNDKAKKQWYYWLKEQKWSCRTCGTHFCTLLSSNNLKWPVLRSWPQRGHTSINLHSFFLLQIRPYQFSYSILHPYCTT